ncbi:hypothetical protein LVB87_11585 [Lysobacter sp. KIS68-7]|uniref:hypothetical protein n=1 Tax=Lysobacter sp. KIS68-7 TaxID=2904252 RepID=UPI001E5DEF3F|nr:hypothetical protein [Lysobacter sp. KIS68-7]UHQ18822.1 hypothetical protein LVB87_11585 [Lysobacter sp. KIS68-7]
MTLAPARPALVPLCAAMSLLLPAADLSAKQPGYTTAPGTPVCTVEPSQPVVCAWTMDTLIPPPDKYSIEAIATYDPDCNGSPDLSQTFKFSIFSRSPVVDIAPASLDVTVCTSGDSPCTVPATYHAKTVQIRVKAMSSTKGASQSAPFSALSVPVTIPGVCLCPDVCVAIGNRVLAATPSFVHRFGCGLQSGIPEIDWYFESNSPLPPDAVTTSYLGGFLAGGEGFGCSEEGPLVERNIIPMSAAEKNACVAQFAPQFAQHFNFACDPTDPNHPYLLNFTPP